MCAWIRPGTTVSPRASMERCAGVLVAGSASAAMRPSASTRMSALRTLWSGSMVTSVPPRMASTPAPPLGAAVRRTGIRGQQQRDVAVRVGGVDPKFDAHALQKGRAALLSGEIGGDVEDEAVGAGLDGAGGQVGDSSVGAGFGVRQRVFALVQRDRQASRRYAAFDVEYVRGQRGHDTAGWPKPGSTR